MTSDKTILRKMILTAALAGFAGTALAGIEEIAHDANRGKDDAQKQLAARYASGNEVVKDDLLSEQWLLRADPNMSAKSGGNALAALQAKQEKESGKAEPEKPKKVAPKQAKEEPKASTPFGNFLPAFSLGASKAEPEAATPKQSVPAEIEEANEVEAEEPAVQVDDFQRLLRAASQGNRLALQRFRTDAELANRLKTYAQTPEGKRNPFVREVITRLKK